MRFSAAGLATTVGGTLAGADVEVEGVGTDSRSLHAGQLFVPLNARRDGHAFIADAVAAGAPAYLTTGPRMPGATAILVTDPGAALPAIGRAARARLPDCVVGITGSVGKTTVKELVAGVLSTTYRTSASPRSFNNEIGVPLTLANAGDDTEAAVVEMGARGGGHIRYLCQIAEPTIGVVTRIGQAHTEQFGDADRVAAAKAELVESLPASGTAVLNADDHRVLAMRNRTDGQVVLFGISPLADITAHGIVLDELARPSFRLMTPEGSADVRLALHGRHQVSNALAAAGVALAANVSFAAIAEGLGGVVPPQWRMSIQCPRAGILLVNDAYNANPTSMQAALEALAAIDASRRIAVLGEMTELGPSSADDHRKVVDIAASLGIALIPYRTESYGTPAVSSNQELVERLEPFHRGDAILVKASRALGLETLIDVLASNIAR
ncbi:MAG: UDP-N-acetylmuramoylalanyl-D-glutamyl-2, 6-diaminopimelate--D-alanyl-D-alanine ligase [Acidimicrobiales bacterium]|nr:MAG: UDP-N-acetylmuramoylalanyl-D-glutamyl-2, 6-diaminopimelate--D-alanyl-D-alanine ligase [Acidimicrobiales bacterium]